MDDSENLSATPVPHPAQICLSDEEIAQIRGFDAALKKLLKRVSQAMTTSLAVIHLPGKQVTVRIDSEDWPLPSAGRVVRELERELARHSENASAVDARAFEPPGCDAAYTVPVFSADNGLEGALLVARGEQGQAFSRRELNLLEAIAANIGDIIAARYDRVTGLINQREFDFVLEKTTAARQDPTKTHTLLHVNLDHLQSIADTFGRKAADVALRTTALTLRSVLDESAIVAHLGADEFGIFIENCPTDRGWVIGQDVRRAIHDMSIVHEEPLKLTASVGVASLSGSETVISALAAARIACVVAKQRGRDRVVLYRHRDAAVLHSNATMRVASNLQQALRDDRFLLYCQAIEPLTPANDSRSVEILLRGIDADGEAVPPGEFLPQAEQNRLMPAIDRWVIRNAFDALAGARQALRGRRCHFAINLSGQSLCDGSFLQFVRDEFSRTAITPGLITFEVTETAAILNIDEAIELMANLRQIGCRFSLDDFGSGLSSFSYLKTLPIDYLKIDGQFVREIVEDPVSNAMVAAINQMSHALGLKTVAEFVENDAIRTQLAGIGVDFGQGYGIARPVPLGDRLDALRKVRTIRRAR